MVRYIIFVIKRLNIIFLINGVNMRIHKKGLFALFAAAALSGCAGSAGFVSRQDQAVLDGMKASNDASTELLELYRTCRDIGGKNTVQGRECLMIADKYQERIHGNNCELMAATMGNNSVHPEIRRNAYRYVKEYCL